MELAKIIYVYFSRLNMGEQLLGSVEESLPNELARSLCFLWDWVANIVLRGIYDSEHFPIRALLFRTIHSSIARQSYFFSNYRTFPSRSRLYENFSGNNAFVALI